MGKGAQKSFLEDLRTSWFSLSILSFAIMFGFGMGFAACRNEASDKFECVQESRPAEHGGIVVECAKVQKGISK